MGPFEQVPVSHFAEALNTNRWRNPLESLGHYHNANVTKRPTAENVRMATHYNLDKSHTLAHGVGLLSRRNQGWRMLKGLRNILIFVVVVGVIQGLIQFYGEKKRDRDIARAVENGNAKLPVVVGGRIRVEREEYSNHTVRLFAAFLGDDGVTQREKDAFEQGLTQMYCKGGMKAFSDAKVAVEYSVKTQFETVAFSMTPDKCR